MNNSSIRFFGIIFIILLFCLSPLAAIDLGEGDNSSQINNNRDLNDAAIAADADYDKDNGIKRDNDAKIQSAHVKDSNSTQKLQSRDPKVSMETQDCVIGEHPIVKIYIMNDNFAFDMYAKVKVDGVGYSKTYTQTLRGGCCNVVTLDNNMPPGTYTVTYTSPYDALFFDSVTVTRTFTVNKLDPAIECSVGDVSYGKAPVIKTTCAEHLENKEAYITSPQFSKEYKFDPTKANEITIDEDLIPGKYTFNVVYPGDSTHKSQNSTKTFTVNKIDSKLTVTAKKTLVYPGEKLYLEFHANKAMTGDVICTLKDKTQTVHLVNGVGNATIDCSDLDPGCYAVSTILRDDDICNNYLVFTHFGVVGDPNLSMHVDDSNSSNDDLHVVVDANKNFTGNATVTLNNHIYTDRLEIVNGHGEGYFPGGDYPGTYTAKVTTKQSVYFIAGNCSTTYEVKNL